MRDLRGIVVDVLEEKGAVIVLTPEGDVREVITNGQQFQLGDEILFYEKVLEPQKGAKWSRRAVRYVSVAAAAGLLFYVSPLQISDLHLGNPVKSKILGGLIGAKDTYADSSIYIESKSNVKIDVKDQKVESAYALNQPAKMVLKDMKRKRNENIDEFMHNYFKEAKEKGYLNHKEPVVVSIDDPSMSGPRKNDLLLEKIRSISEEQHINVVAMAVPDEVVKKAEDLGITPGKLAISLVAKASTGQTISLDTLKKASVAELINTAPNVVKDLSCLTEEKLKQLVRDVSIVPATEDNQATEASNTENMTTYIGSESTTTENMTTDSNNGTQTDKSSEYSSPEKSKEQPESQPKESNNDQQNDSQKQEKDQKQEDKKQEGQEPKKGQEEQPKQDDQAKDDQTQQDKQKQDNQQPDDQPKDDQNKDTQQPDDQHKDTQQPDDQNKDNQNKDTQQPDDQHKDDQLKDDQPQVGQDEQSDNKDHSTVATIFEWIKNVLHLR